jgi:hypothetical protein
VGVEPTTSAAAYVVVQAVTRWLFLLWHDVSYFLSAALSSGVSSLSECDLAGVVLLALLVSLFISFCSECAGCPVRISVAISCGVSFPCSCPSVAESLRWVDTAITKMMAARAAPEINNTVDFLFISNSFWCGQLTY